MRDAVSGQLNLQNNYIHQEDFKEAVPFCPYDDKIEKHGEITIVQSTGGSRLEMLMQTN